MSRILILTVLLAGLTAAAFSQPSGRPAALKADADKKPADKAALPTARSVVETLISPVDFPGYDDPKVTLGDVLDQLGKIHRLEFDVNEKAFKREGLAEVLKTLVANSPIPPMRTTFGKVLARILDRVPAPSGATFLVREDGIQITTVELLATEIKVRRRVQAPGKAAPRALGAAGGAKGVPMKDEENDDLLRNMIDLPVVSVSVERQPLEEALRQMRVQANFNLVFDPGLGEKAKTTVTLTLLNAPFDGALRVLTEMTELDYVWLDNIFYITSRDKAQKLRATWPDRRSSGKAPIITTAGGAPAAGM